MIIVYVIAGIVALFILMGILSQKGEAAGLIKGRLAEPGSKPNVVCSEDGTQPERAVAPLKASIEEVVDAIKMTGGTITSRSEEYVSATYMSRIFKFVDDVEVRTDRDLCQIRSASRIGYSDRGVNRKRVESIRAVLQSTRVSET